jgi:hypothetical protein
VWGLIEQKKFVSRNRQVTSILRNKSKATFVHAPCYEDVLGQWSYCWPSESVDIRASADVLVKKELLSSAGNQTPACHYIASHFTHCSPTLTQVRHEDGNLTGFLSKFQFVQT